MKKYLVSYQTKRRRMNPENHSCIEYAENKTRLRKDFNAGKITKIEELEEYEKENKNGYIGGEIVKKMIEAMEKQNN